MLIKLIDLHCNIKIVKITDKSEIVFQSFNFYYMCMWVKKWLIYKKKLEEFKTKVTKYILIIQLCQL